MMMGSKTIIMIGATIQVARTTIADVILPRRDRRHRGSVVGKHRPHLSLRIVAYLTLHPVAGAVIEKRDAASLVCLLNDRVGRGSQFPCPRTGSPSATTPTI